MRTTRKLIIFVFTFLTLAANAHAQSPREELQQMVVQLQKTPNDDALREKIIKQAQTLKPAPEIPEEARRHLVRGNSAFIDAKTAADFARAATFFEEASTVAPWWADAYFNLAKTREAQNDYAGALHALHFHLALPLPAADKRQAQDLVYTLEEKRDRKKADDTEASVTERFVGTWSRSVLGGDREYHRQWFTLSRDGAGLSISGMKTEGGKPPYDIVVRGDELEMKVPYTWIMPDGSRPVLAVGVVVFTLSADGRSMTSRQTLLPYTSSQQKHWDNWGEPGEAYGRTPWAKN